MMDDHGTTPQQLAAPSIAVRPSSRTARSRSGQSYSGYETAESSAVASARHDPYSKGRRTLTSEPHAGELGSNQVGRMYADNDAIDGAPGKRRPQRPRPSGGFLLPNNLVNDQSARKNGAARDEARRRSKIPVVDSNRKGKSPLRTPDKGRLAPPDPLGLAIDARDMDGAAGDRRLSNGQVAPPTRIPSPRLSPSPLDVDSTQIVNMALNLSESRRIAQRRYISSPLPSMPPRLAPLPDSPAGGSLKQHLQQQRRTSRNLSPKPDRNSLAPRNISMSSSRINSPLQTSFDSETSYTYHFSSSTLNRAQKAKEQLELMSQYRRLLQLVPPLDRTAYAANRPSTSSPPTSPTGTSTPSDPFYTTPVTLGRPYNPLQYIRNRKVRARERKAIDGESQGFVDLIKVTEWVDEAEASAAASPGNAGSATLPIFSGAHGPDAQQSAHQNASVPNSSSTKSKRPRIDWAIDPADMLADLYWVEQDDNKFLIEDRHYTRIFPRKTTAPSRPMSQQAVEPVLPPLVPAAALKEVDSSDASVEPAPSDSNVISRADTDVSHMSARERARQKLHDLRGKGGMNHAHNSSVHSHHDFLRPLRRGSLSDTSDSESDRKVRDRSGTIGANGKAILEKQMNEMLAREALEAQKQAVEDADSDQHKPLPSKQMTPERTAEGSSRGHSPRDSRVEDNDILERLNRGRFRPSSPLHSGRASLEVPGWNPRLSMDIDSSLPASPDLKATRGDSYHVLPIGVDLSPPESRPGSPSRNPLSKVKNMFRDRSRDRRERVERTQEHSANDKDDTPDSPVEPAEQHALSPISAEAMNSPQRRRSRSAAARKLVSRGTHESHKSHRSVGSIRLGRDDQIGLRTIFKGGAKIDSVIRGGVSKVSDFLWQKEKEPGEDGISGTSGDDSEEVEQMRGRLGKPATVSPSGSELQLENHEAKSYLDIMPAFRSTSEIDKSTSHQPSPSADNVLIVPLDTPSPPSRRSSRFDMLKPPRIDVSNASPTASPILPPKRRPPLDSEFSDSDSQALVRSSGKFAVEGARRTSTQLNAILSLQAPANRPHPNALTGKSRHWSISDRSPSPALRKVQLSKPEIARLRSLLLSSGIKAMEIVRRASEPHPLFAIDNSAVGLPWTEMARFASPEQSRLSVAQIQVFTITAAILKSSIAASGQKLREQTEAFVQGDMRQLGARVDNLHARVASELIDWTRRAADDADECSHDLLDGQRLKVKSVVDIIDKMMRNRRRRFRWVRRAGWLAVEWVLVGFMWYVWLVVMIARIVLGLGKGVVGFLQWILWL